MSGGLGASQCDCATLIAPRGTGPGSLTPVLPGKLRHQARTVLLEKDGHRHEVLRLSLCQLLPSSSDICAAGKLQKQGL